VCPRLQRIAGYQKAIPAMLDNLRVRTHRAGKHNASCAHGLGDDHAEWLSARLQIQAEPAGHQFAGEAALAQQPVKNQTWLRGSGFVWIAPQARPSENMKREA
jgi:hypothetical protein